MNLLYEPIILTILCLALLWGFIALRSFIRVELWLVILTVLILALPRAGLVLPFLRLPLPFAHLIAGLCIFEWLLRRPNPLQSNPHMGRYFLLYAGIAGFGLALGLSTGGWYMTAILELIFYLLVMGIFFYTAETFDQPHHFTTFIRLALIIALGISLYGIAQRFLGARILIPYLTYTTGGLDLTRSYVEAVNIENIRVLSSYGDPNVLASQLVMFVGIAFALLISRGVSGWMRLFCLVILISNVFCILLTQSRAGLLCVFIVPTLILCWRWRPAIVLIPLVLTGVFLLASQDIGAILATRFHDLLDPTDIRTHFPQMAWKLLQAAPFGSGFGRTVKLQIDGFDWSFVVVNAKVIWSGFNSFWLNLFSRLGLPGILSFILVLVVTFRYVWIQSRHIQNMAVKAALIGTLAGFFGQTLIWLVNNTYMMPGGGLNFWFVMGMMVAGSRAFNPQLNPMTIPMYPVWPGQQPMPA
ncbi:MAG: hypothetical protein JW860_13105 [Sedimentisphaerales bacterium]|nr:hypothetical protein [Sedimentisphaerales bacterium]